MNSAAQPRKEFGRYDPEKDREIENIPDFGYGTISMD